MKAHSLITEAYNDTITIVFAGVGGTGSLLLHMLARMAVALKDIRNITLKVLVMDADTVTGSNIGRQCFAPYDIGRNKAVVVTERINRFYGLEWDSSAFNYPIGIKEKYVRNIIISCVDSVASRMKIEKHLVNSYKHLAADHGYRFAYWLDCGNNFDNGNVVLTNMANMPAISSYLSDTKVKKPRASCSLATALGNQHIMVNSWCANIAGTILWDMLYDHRVDVYAAFFNLKTLQVRTLKSNKHEHRSVQTSTVDAV